MTPRRLALVAESPLGGSGYLIDTLLAQAGIERSACFFGVLGPTLRDDLAAYDPHFVLLLDRFGGALRVFSGEKRGIDNWRGSVFMSTFVGKPVKVMATFHAARLQMEHGLTGVVRFDIARAVRELVTDALTLPVDHIAIDLTKDELISRLRDIRSRKLTIATDIEGFCTGISCIGFATGPNTAFVVPFIRHDNTSYWNETDELELWEAVAAVLEDPAVPKIAHNALYEFFCLAWAYGIVIRGLEHDTMVMHFELYAEMEKSLGFCTSIYTAHPYYKSERKSTDDRALLLYNGKDCCRTYECWRVMSPKLMPKQRAHYEFNMSLLVPLAYMSLRGFRYDKAAAERRLADVQRQIYEKQDEINREAASGTGWPRLTAFYEGLGNGRTIPTDNGGSGVEAIASRVRSESEDHHDTVPTAALVALFADAFCKARRTEEREVEETTWQPCKWNGKKWVKAGKRLPEATVGVWCKDFAPDWQNTDLWFKPITKKVRRNGDVAVQSLADVQRFAKDSCAADCRAAVRLFAGLQACMESIANGADRRHAICGELATLLDIHVKINSTGVGGGAQRYLYGHCKLPEQFQKIVTGPGGPTVTIRFATDDEAVIKAYLASGKTEEKRDKRALVFLKMRKLVTESKTLGADCDSDGRMRCGYNLVGTDTHRLACYESPTGSGYNLQTVTKTHRDMFVADEGCWLGQRDLAGADGWTVAAYSAMLGDTTMLDDYNAKLKPAQILVLMQERGSFVNTMDRDALRPLCKTITEETTWRYAFMKMVQHLSSYKGGAKGASEKLLIESYKKTGDPIYVTPALFEEMRETCFFARYPGVRRLHQWMEREIADKGMLTASNGFSRKFYGRKTGKDAHGTIRAALATLPQVYTTYATTLAVSRLWSDDTNRRADGSLRVEPLHTVHDSLVSQWPKDETDYAKLKLREWFNNEIMIADRKIVIPASGSYGPDWKNQDFEL